MRRGKTYLKLVVKAKGAGVADIMIPAIVIAAVRSFWRPQANDLVNDLPWHFCWCRFCRILKKSALPHRDFITYVMLQKVAELIVR